MGGVSDTGYTHVYNIQTHIHKAPTCVRRQPARGGGPLRDEGQDAQGDGRQRRVVVGRGLRAVRLHEGACGVCRWCWVKCTRHAHIYTSATAFVPRKPSAGPTCQKQKGGAKGTLTRRQDAAAHDPVPPHGRQAVQRHRGRARVVRGQARQRMLQHGIAQSRPQTQLSIVVIAVAGRRCSTGGGGSGSGVGVGNVGVPALGWVVGFAG